MRTTTALFSCALACAVPSVARADDDKACADAYTRARDHYKRAQAQTDALEFIEARAQLQVCGSSPCAKWIVDDCTQWLGAVDALLKPSIALVVTDEHGVDVVDVRLAVDAQGVDFHDGVPFELDPGEHKLVIGAKGYRAEHRTYMARLGEKRIRVPIVLTASVASTEVPEPEGEGTTSPVPAASLVAFGAAGAGLVVGTVFTILAVNAKSSAGCPDVNNCPTSFDVAAQNNRVRGDSIAAGIGFGVALVGAGLGTWFLMADTSAKVRSQPATTGAVRLSPRVGLGWAGIGGTFQ